MFKNIYRHYIASFSGLSRDAWFLAWVMFINRSGSMVLFFLMLYLTNELKMSIETAGQIFSLYGLGAMAGSYLGGWLSDKYGTKAVQVISLISGGIGYIILANIKSTPIIAIMLFIIALLAESFRPASTTAMANACTPETRMRGFALNRLAINLGVAIGPALGGFLALYNYDLIFWVEGLTSILAAFFLLYLFHESDSEKSDNVKYANPIAVSPFRDGIYIQLLILLLVIGVTFNQLFNTWPIFLKDVYFFTEDNIGLLMALNALIIVLFEMPLVHKLQRLNILYVVAVGSVLMCFGFGAVMFFNTISYVAFTVLIWSVGEMLAFPLVVTFIANRAHDTKRGAYLGMMTFTFSFSFVLGPILGSWMYENLGPVILWVFIIGLGLITVPGYLFIEYRTRKAAAKV